MRIAVMAAGALGSYFGGRLAAAGNDVVFIARGPQRDAIKTNGLRITSVLGDLYLPNPVVTEDTTAIGPVDVVLFAVKLWDTEAAAQQLLPIVGPQTRVITLQNGVDSPERLIPILSAETVITGCAYIAAVLSTPGVVSHTSAFARIVCGRLDGLPDTRLTGFVDAAHKAGIDITLTDAIDRERWQKFVFLAGLSGATGTMRKPLGPIREDPDTRAFLHRLMREVVAVGRAKGVSLAVDQADQSLKFADAAPPHFKASLLHDLERRRRLELDWLAGKVVELGRANSVPTPANEAVYTILKLHRMGSRDVNGAEP